MFWIVNKKEKKLCLCGHYSGNYFPKDEERFVTIHDCDCEYPKVGFDLYKEYLLINPLEGYKFMVNKDEYEAHSRPRFFPCVNCYNSPKVVVTNDAGTGSNGEHFYSSSLSDFVAFMEEIYQAFSYETRCRSLKYRETEGWMKEDDYEPAYYYGSGRGCCLFVKKKNI